MIRCFRQAIAETTASVLRAPSAAPVKYSTDVNLLDEKFSLSVETSQRLGDSESVCLFAD
jgi:hypothetical protein